MKIRLMGIILSFLLSAESIYVPVSSKIQEPDKSEFNTLKESEQSFELLEQEEKQEEAEKHDPKELEQDLKPSSSKQKEDEEKKIEKEGGNKKENQEEKKKKKEKQKEKGGKEEILFQADTPVKGADRLNVIIQDTAERKLKLDGLETLDGSIKKEGYHIEGSRNITCHHTSGDINGSILCTPGKAEKNPTKEELKANLKATGILKKKPYKTWIADVDKGGTKNTVSHFAMYAEVKGVGGTSMPLAEPYVCQGDGYAGYAYYEHFLSYCPNIDQFFQVGASHIWLGCTKGDVGSNESASTPCTHTFPIYKFVPDIYRVKLSNQGAETAGTENIYERYKDGWYLNEKCSKALHTPDKISRISLPKRAGCQFQGYYDAKSGGTQMINAEGALTSKGRASYKMLGNQTWYAQWKPNVLMVKYHANGGSIMGSPSSDIRTFTSNWSYKSSAKDPKNFSSFGLARTGYDRKDGAEWNIKSDGKGTSFDQDVKYEMLEYAPNLKNGDQTITLYAQWTPKTYTVTLDHQLKSPEAAGTPKIYEKYNTGWYLDSKCTKKLIEIAPPQKMGYVFQGYYSAKIGGTQMINKDGELTVSGTNNCKLAKNATWYAHYKYQIGCTDYVDIPCDLTKQKEDNREEFGVQIAYEEGTGKVKVHTDGGSTSVALEGKPAGTKTGTFISILAGSSASSLTDGEGNGELSLTPREGTAYQLKTVRQGKTLCDRVIYFQNGRFRTLVKLGEKGTKEAAQGSALSGSAWGTEENAYAFYQYDSCTELKNIQAPGNVCRYFTYKDVNLAYSGNGATSGTNILEQNVSLEDAYQFRANGFEKETVEKKKTADQKEYECRVKYRFVEWGMKWTVYQENQKKETQKIYQEAGNVNAVSDHTTEDIHTYQIAEPIPVAGSILGLFDSRKGASKNQQVRGAKDQAKEYINFQAKWNAFPTIVVTPGDSLEFYEGEEVTKEDLANHLTSHDKEDNDRKKQPYVPDLNDKLRIVKVSYPESENKSQKAYERVYEEDVPEDFLLDTYYLKLEKDEVVEVQVTFAVTDKDGNTTKETFPVKVKYNNYPEISSEDIFYYFKEEANKGEITEEALLGRGTAQDAEDGDLTDQLGLRDFDPQGIKMQTEAKTEFTITYQVTDAYKKTTYKTVTLLVWDEDAVIAETPKYYVRYISEKYLDTLEKNSAWREVENMAYLKRILWNETPMEVWEFTHEDVLAVQEWITEDGDGNWKIGKRANQEFLKRFAYCKQ
ncbi:MAG: hypothetical protein HFH41_03810 [Lachnospiraceae bacterium]|nr:hypothetical protein [Lachnospiraceae bacterium]